MLNTITDYSSRIAAGKAKEALIIDELRIKGLNIELPTASQDKYDKIDGFFITAKTQKRLSFQLKFRESGDDVIFEIIKDWDNNIEGRDLISKAEVYIIVDRHGKVNMYSTKLIKDKAKELLDLADSNPKENQEGNGWQMKFTIDKATGSTKLMAYLKPTLFPSFFSCIIPNYN